MSAVSRQVQEDPRIRGFVIRGLPRPGKIGKLKKQTVRNLKTRAERERVETWWNPATQTRPVLDSSFVPVPTLLRKLSTILLVAFSLFELVAALSQFLCSESNKKNGEVGEYPQ